MRLTTVTVAVAASLFTAVNVLPASAADGDIRVRTTDLGDEAAYAWF